MYAYGQYPMMRPQFSIHGRLLELTVIGCRFPKNEKKDVYLHVEYADVRRTIKFGRTAEEKVVVNLIEGNHQIVVEAWQKRAVGADAFIGSAKVQLEKVFSEGHIDLWSPLVCKAGKHSCDVRIILFYKDAMNMATSSGWQPPAAQYSYPPPSLVHYHTGYPPYDQNQPAPPANGYSHHPYHQPYPPPPPLPQPSLDPPPPPQPSLYPPPPY